jgi:hypothetical protein
MILAKHLVVVVMGWDGTSWLRAGRERGLSSPQHTYLVPATSDERLFLNNFLSCHDMVGCLGGML